MRVKTENACNLFSTKQNILSRFYVLLICIFCLFICFGFGFIFLCVFFAVVILVKCGEQKQRRCQEILASLTEVGPSPLGADWGPSRQSGTGPISVHKPAQLSWGETSH